MACRQHGDVVLCCSRDTKPYPAPATVVHSQHGGYASAKPISPLLQSRSTCDAAACLPPVSKLYDFRGYPGVARVQLLQAWFPLLQDWGIQGLVASARLSALVRYFGTSFVEHGGVETSSDRQVLQGRTLCRFAHRALLFDVPHGRLAPGAAL